MLQQKLQVCTCNHHDQRPAQACIDRLQAHGGRGTAALLTRCSSGFFSTLGCPLPTSPALKPFGAGTPPKIFFGTSKGPPPNNFLIIFRRVALKPVPPRGLPKKRCLLQLRQLSHDVGDSFAPRIPSFWSTLQSGR